MQDRERRETRELEASVERGIRAQREMLQEAGAHTRDLSLLRASMEKVLRVLFEGNGDSLVSRVSMLERASEQGRKESGGQSQRRWDILILVAGAIVTLVVERILGFGGHP